MSNCIIDKDQVNMSLHENDMNKQELKEEYNETEPSVDIAHERN